jgi:hypothetical protein
MPALSEEFKNAVLAGIFGPTRGSTAPDDWDVELYVDNPQVPGASEVDWTGYAAVNWSADDFEAPDGAVVLSVGLVNFGAMSDAGTEAARYWALRNTTSGALAYSMPLERPLRPSGSNPVKTRLAVPYGGNL